MKIMGGMYMGVVVVLVFVRGCWVSKLIGEGDYVVENVKVE